MATGLERARAILSSEFAEATEHPKLARALEVVDRAGSAIGDGTARIEAIVTRLRSFARLDEAQFQEVRIEACIDDVVALLAPALGEVSIDTSYAATPPIRCAPAALNQALLNVVSNAADASAGGAVEITTAVADDTVWVTVADRGHGIAPEHIERIFDPGSPGPACPAVGRRFLRACPARVERDRRRSRVNASDPAWPGSRGAGVQLAPNHSW